MKLTCMGMEYPCARAVRDEAAGFVRAYDGAGALVFQAVKVKNFSGYTLEGGEWEQEVPTQEERLEDLEVLMAEVLFGGEGV